MKSFGKVGFNSKLGVKVIRKGSRWRRFATFFGNLFRRSK